MHSWAWQCRAHSESVPQVVGTAPLNHPDVHSLAPREQKCKTPLAGMQRLIVPSCTVLLLAVRRACTGTFHLSNKTSIVIST